MINNSLLPRRTVLKATAAALPLSKWPLKSTTSESVFVEDDESQIRIGNEKLEVTFRKDNGGIEQVRDVEQDRTLQEMSVKDPAMTWELSFYHPETPNLTAGSHSAGKPSITTNVGETETTVTLEWSNPELFPPVSDAFTGTITVTVTVREDDPLSYWRTDVQNNDELAIRSVDCPKILAIKPLVDDGTDGIVLPDRMGRRYVDPTTKFEELGEEAGMIYPSGFGTMQFTAYTGPDGGFYSDARDAEGYVKRFLWRQSWEEPDLLGFEASYSPPQLPGESISVPYPVTFGSLDGDWHEAADRYRSWVDSEGWLADVNPGQPTWLRDLGATYRIETYHPEGATVEFDRASELVLDMQSFLDVPLQFQFGQWQHGPDDSPVEGWESFTETVGDLTSAGIRTNSFVGGNVISRDSSVFQENENATEWVVRDQNGEPDWIGDQEQLYPIESTQDGWQQYIRDYIENLLDRGVTEIQYDGFPYVLPECYDPNHDHDPGQGGNWFASAAWEDTRELQDLLRAADDGVLSGEGICDFYVPFMDAFNTREVFTEYFSQHVESGWFETIPLFEYAFGDLVVTRNQNHEGIEMAPSLGRLFTARSLLWGALPVFRYGDPEADPEVPSLDNPSDHMTYFRRVAQARANYANRFLARGEMLRQPELESDEVRLQGSQGVEIETEGLVGSAWRSTHGETGIVLTNVTGESPEMFQAELRFDEQPFDVPDGETFTYLVRNGVYEQLDEPSTGSVTVQVPPDEVILVVVSPTISGQADALDTIVAAQTEADTEEREELVVQAKRAFEDQDYTSAIESASQVTQRTTTSTPSESSTTTDAEDASETTGQGGFTIITGAAAAATGLAARWLYNQYTGDQADEE